MVTIEIPTEDHIKYLVEHISKDDEREVLGLGLTVDWALRHSIETAEEVYCILWNGIPVTILGVGQAHPFDEYYTPWLLATDELPRHPVKVMRYSWAFLKKWLTKYGKLQNHVDFRHERARAWLEVLGAQFELEPEHGPYKRPYFKFTLGE